VSSDWLFGCLHTFYGTPRLSEFIGAWTNTTILRIIALLIVLTSCLLVLLNKKEQAKPFAFVGLCFFLSYFIVFGIKFLLARYRPDMYFQHHYFGFSFFSFEHARTSFPSGHAIAAFSIAMPLFYVIKNKWVWGTAFLIATCIGISVVAYLLNSIAHMAKR